MVKRGLTGHPAPRPAAAGGRGTARLLAGVGVPAHLPGWAAGRSLAGVDSRADIRGSLVPQRLQKTHSSPRHRPSGAIMVNLRHQKRLICAPRRGSATSTPSCPCPFGVVLVSRASAMHCRSGAVGRRGSALLRGSWSVGGGAAGTGEGNPALLPEAGQVGCHRASCRYGPQSLADDQGALDRRVSGVPGRVGGVRLRDEFGLGDARVVDPQYQRAIRIGRSMPSASRQRAEPGLPCCRVREGDRGKFAVACLRVPLL